MSVFAAEMVAKFIALRWIYFHDRWNCFDCLLAWLGIVDTIVLSVVYKSNAMAQISVIRIFRLLRLMRMVKVLTIQRQLEVLVEGIAASLKSMFWIGLLLGVLIYTCAIFCVVVIGRADYADSYPDFDNHMFFGTIWRSMLSLFNIVLLTEWAEVIRPVFDNQPACIPIFVVFIIFTTFGILNVIIGVVVERTNEAAARIRRDDMEREMEQKMQVVQQLSQVMSELDKDQDSVLTEQELLNAAGNDSFGEMLARIELPKGFSLSDLHLMLDQNVDKSLTEGEFVDGMYRLIYSDDYQRMCMIQLAMAQLKHQVSQQLGLLRQDTKHLIESSFVQVASEIASLRAELTGTSDTPMRTRPCSMEMSPTTAEVTDDIMQTLPTPCKNGAKTKSRQSQLSSSREMSRIPSIPSMPECEPKAAARLSPAKLSSYPVTPPPLDLLLETQDSTYFQTGTAGPMHLIETRDCTYFSTEASGPWGPVRLVEASGPAGPVLLVEASCQRPNGVNSSIESRSESRVQSRSESRLLQQSSSAYLSSRS
jgi:voltage-gated sodium channel